VDVSTVVVIFVVIAIGVVVVFVCVGDVAVVARVLLLWLSVLVFDGVVVVGVVVVVVCDVSGCMCRYRPRHLLEQPLV
jgi:hypothetical protein